MFALSLYLFFGGFALFLLGLAVFMHFENRKFGDNQFVMKLLPPPVPSASMGALEAADTASVPNRAIPLSDWTAVPEPAFAPVPGRGRRLSQAA